MIIPNYVWIIGAIGIAALLAWFQYYVSVRRKPKNTWAYALLRFATLFCVFLLLINPQIKNTISSTEKASLIVAVDNSSSISYLQQKEQVRQAVAKIRDNSELSERFNIVYYSFGQEIRDTMDFNFEEKQTRITDLLEEVRQSYRDSRAPVVLITDGNQTLGTDYQYLGSRLNSPVYPIAVGDTVSGLDLKVQYLNVNRYTYLKNRFPVEAILTYSGDQTIRTNFQILSGTSVLQTKPLVFSPEKPSQTVTTTLLAAKPGTATYTIRVVPVDGEVNTINNTRKFAVEVLDQKTNILLLSDIIHPDLGAIKKSIESNERRKVVIKKPTDNIAIDEYSAVIVYQPNSRFQNMLARLDKARKNRMYIMGTATDWTFFNRIQKDVQMPFSGQTEDFTPRYNSAYGAFLTSDIGFDAYPPLAGAFGEPQIRVNPNVLLHKVVNGIATENPLLFTYEKEENTFAVLLGENIWRWRAQEYLSNQNFEQFDNFFSKIVQYISTTQKKDRLNVDAESFYYGNGSIRIQATYFTKNYEFDPRGELILTVRNKATKEVKTYPFLLKKSNYEVRLDGIEAGTYTYSVAVKGTKLSQSGSFEIIDFDVEKQFLNADMKRLRTLASTTGGQTHTIMQIDQLIQKLQADENYLPLQKNQEKLQPLIDWKILLGIILLLLSVEWLMRKYNGLI